MNEPSHKAEIDAMVRERVAAALNAAADELAGQAGCTCEACETYNHAARIVRARATLGASA